MARKKKTPAHLMNSEFERNENDLYRTEPWCTRALCRRVEVSSFGRIMEPCAGAGDITAVLQAAGAVVDSYDLDISNHDYALCDDIKQADFLETETLPWDVDAIITNPPYGVLAQKIVHKSLSFPQVTLVAMLLKSTWNTSPGRNDSRRNLFANQAGLDFPFAYELVLMDRPRWDKWWEGGEPDYPPFHPYSWFVWDRKWNGPSTQFFEGTRDE